MRRVVVKVGSAVLTEGDSIAEERLKALVEFLVDLKRENEVLLVSSGAVAAGYTKVQLDRSILKNKQALASIGQPVLMHKYATEFQKHSIITSQVLVTAANLNRDEETRKIKDTVDTLLASGVIPIINENDATATEELVVGDNDQLSAYMTKHTNSDLLIILSDIDAYYDEDPHKNPNAKVQKVVKEIDECALSREATPHGTFATGGIVTKLKAASYLLKNDINMFLASGFDLSDAKSYMLGGKHMGGTLFCRGEA